MGKERISAVWATEAGGKILLFAHGGKVYRCSAGGVPVADQVLCSLEVGGRE